MSIQIISENNKEKILEDISYVEKLFFGSRKAPEPLVKKQSEATKPNKKQETPEISQAPQAQDESEQSEVGEQILLPDVGSFTEAVYVNVGSVWLKKAKRKSTCLNLLLNGNPAYIVGSYFAEDDIIPTLSYGDKIRVEKISQFKRAANREHAKSAKFKITKI